MVSKKLIDGYEKTKKICNFFENESNVGNVDFTSLNNFLESIGDVKANVFFSIYSKNDLEQLKNSETAIKKNDIDSVRDVRIKRQKVLIGEGCDIKVDKWDLNVFKE